MTITPANTTPGEIFAIDLATLAREIAMDIFPLDQILELHRLTDAEWQRIQETPKFKEMLQQLMVEWNGTGSTIERVRVKASTGLESTLEVYIRAIADPTIPLNQRVEAGKFLARLGELDGRDIVAPSGGVGGFSINIHFDRGDGKQPVTIEGQRITATDVD